MDWQEQLKIIQRGAEEVLPEEELIEKLKKKRPLRVKLGIDASGPDIHLGFAVVLWKLREFQDLGHTAILIVGDFTAKIGDPTGRSKTRPQLTDEDVKQNMANYKRQVFKILREDRTEFRYNSEWLSRLTAEDIVKLASRTTVARMLERDDFSKRYSNNIPISLHEFLYPIFQAYDSVVVKSDIELGGTDQKFNFLLARDYQEAEGIEPQVLVMMPLLEGLDGKLKMSKSYGNYIGIEDPPEEMYGKTMSIPDSLIIRYFKLCLRYTDDKLATLQRDLNAGINPMELKKKLARELVALYYSEEDARRAEEHFVRIFAQRQAPVDMPEVLLDKNSVWIVELIWRTGLVNSKSEARRLIREGAVSINGEKITDENADITIEDGSVLKLGKRRFARIRRAGE